mgnify:CR=1 FL=1
MDAMAREGRLLIKNQALVEEFLDSNYKKEVCHFWILNWLFHHEAVRSYHLNNVLPCRLCFHIEVETDIFSV